MRMGTTSTLKQLHTYTILGTLLFFRKALNFLAHNVNNQVISLLMNTGSMFS